MIFVIGSGPAGIACVKALLKRGLTVTMLDVGVELEADKQNKLNNIVNNSNLRTFNELKSLVDGDDNIKLSYGSDYPYRGVDKHIKFMIDPQVYCKPSFAQGGLTNVWGSFITPYNANEIQDWPVKLQLLEPYYKEILKFVPLAYPAKEGSCFYPLYTEKPLHYQLSKQALHLFNHYQCNQLGLNKNYLQYGTPRLAVNFVNQKDEAKCTYCGLCQYGCPYQLIYSTKHTLNELKKDPHFIYIQNVIVDRLVEKKHEVIIYSHDFSTLSAKTFVASQVFVACGAIGSTQLILASLQVYNQAIKILDSQHFMFPALLYKRFKNVEKEKLHALCQLYLRISDRTVAPNTIHVQVYTYMEHYENQFKRLAKGLYPIFKFLLKPLLERMIVIQAYLHSNDSSAFSMKMQIDNSISVEYMENKNAKTYIKKTLNFLFSKRKLLGFIPLKFMTKISKPGRSYHYGGSFPMHKDPRKYETDLLGKLPCYKRIHLVDASIFPTIPAQSITLSIMANAYRIASECEIYE